MKTKVLICILTVLFISSCSLFNYTPPAQQEQVTNEDLVRKICGDEGVGNSIILKLANKYNINLLGLHNLILDSTTLTILFEEHTGITTPDVNRILNNAEDNLDLSYMTYEYWLELLIKDTEKIKQANGLLVRRFGQFGVNDIIVSCDKKLLRASIQDFRNWLNP